ncbi:MAG: ankyrin repeat domain-containing protein [Candidatus Cybelea sp.]
MSLHYAINAGDPESALRLLLGGADVFERDAEGRSALTQAVRYALHFAKRRDREAMARIRIGELLVQYARAIPPERFSLPDAVSAAYPEAIAFALEKAPPEDLIEAAVPVIQADDGALLQRLIAAGLSGNARLRWHGYEDMPLLSFAAFYGSAASIAVLLAAGADVNARQQPTARPTWWRMPAITALMVAAGAKNLNAVKRLLEASAELNAQDGRGRTALTYARDFGSRRVTAYLERALEGSGAENELSLHEAARLGVISRIRSLLAEGAQIDARDGEGKTALVHAAMAGEAAAVRMLCEAGADVNAGAGSYDLWDYLLAPNAPVDAETVKTLIAHALDPNRPSESFGTPLVRATWKANAGTLVELLIAHGADAHAIVPQALVERRLSSLPPRKRTSITGPLRTLEYAQRFAPKETYLAMARAAGAELSDAQTLYDRLRAQLKECAALACGEAFAAEAKRVGEILHATPQPWRRRKGVLHYVSTADHTQMSDLQAEVAAKGFTIVYTEFDTELKALTRLLLFPVADSLVALAACGTNGTNFGLATRDIVEWCATTRTQQPLSVIGAGYDFMELRFALPLTDGAALASSAARLCPNLRLNPDDPQAVRRFADELSRVGRLFFWWD